MTQGHETSEQIIHRQREAKVLLGDVYIQSRFAVRSHVSKSALHAMLAA